jgi:hypothetical protein
MSLILLLYALYLNYSEGVDFRQCDMCESSKTYMITQPVLSSSEINDVRKSFESDSFKLDPLKNRGNVKGSKMNYKQIMNTNPNIVDVFMNAQTESEVSKIFNKTIKFAPKTDPYRIFLRKYSEDKDHINWHYDSNFTKGQRITLVIPIYASYCNTSEFMIKDPKTGEEITKTVNMGEGIVYDGSNVYHKITNQTQGCERFVVVIPMYENFQSTLFGGVRKCVRSVTDQIFSL